MEGSPDRHGDDGRPAPDTEWKADELVGCRVIDVGEVIDVYVGRSVDALEVRLDATGKLLLIPLHGDAIRRVDVDAREIEADLEFLRRELGEPDEGEPDKDGEDQ